MKKVSAMASGATIICSQYIGSGNKKENNRAAGQVVLSVFVISLSITVFSYPFLALFSAGAAFATLLSVSCGAVV